MSFLRRNQDKDTAQATPMPQQPPPKPVANTDEGGNIFTRFRDWLVGTYNGVVRVVLGPSLPSRGTIFALILGMIIGMFWAYLVRPVQWAGGNPNRLNQAAQDQWLKMAAVGFDQDTFYDADQTAILLNQVEDPIANLQRLVEAATPGTADYNALVTLLEGISGFELPGTPSPQPPSVLEQAIDILLPLILFTVIFMIIVIVWRLLIQPNIVGPMQDRVRMARDPEYAAQRQQAQASLKAMQQQRQMIDQMKRQTVADAELGQPVMQSLSIFKRNLPYDDSKEIERETAKGSDFLGQCGAVLAEAFDPDPLAIEIWMFDMSTQQDRKKVFVTPQAANDPTVRSRLSASVENPATDIVVAQPGNSLVIDSDALRLKATIAEANIGADGRFDSANIQLQAWAKNAQSAPAGAPAMGMAQTPQASAPMPTPAAQPQYTPPTYNPPTYTPPATPQAPQPQPQTPQPLSPTPPWPPQSRPPMDGDTAPAPPGMGMPRPGGTFPSMEEMEDEDDDPFGLSGDFRPRSG